MKSDNVAIQFSNPNVPMLGKHIEHAASRKLPLVRHNQHADLYGAVICGSGPSLLSKRTLNAIRAKARNPKWRIFACKESIRFLRERNIRVDYSVSMDPGANQTEKTYRDKDITYCVASSCNPVLFDWLLDYGCKVNVFHSACGWPNEVIAYRQLFGSGDTIIGGFTVLNRALGLAEYMGFQNFVLAGAQFGWRQDQDYYATGAKGKHLTDVTMTDHGAVDGKAWWTRPDMLASAVAIAHLKQKRKPGTITILGDSLAQSLSKRSPEYLRDIANIGKPKPIQVPPQQTGDAGTQVKDGSQDSVGFA
jgi:hypothetical protein